MKKTWVLTSFLTSVITNEWNLSLLYFISLFFFYWNKPTCTQFYWSLIEVLSKSDSNTALVTKRTPLNFCWTTHCKLNKKKNSNLCRTVLIFVWQDIPWLGALSLVEASVGPVYGWLWGPQCPALWSDHPHGCSRWPVSHQLLFPGQAGLSPKRKRKFCM